MSTLYTEHEGMALSAIFLENSALYDIDVRESDFSTSFGRRVFKSITRVIDAGTGADILSVRDALLNDGGPAVNYADVLELRDLSPTAANIGYYADHVIEAARRRNLERLGRELTEAAGSARSEDTVALVDRRLRGLERDEIRHDHIGPGAWEAYRDIEERREAGGSLPGISTGFPRFDNLTGGLEPERYYVIAGRPGTGKTMAGLHLVRSVCERGFAFGYIALENPPRQLLNRMYADLAEVELKRIRNAQMTSQELARVKLAAEKVASWQLYMIGASENNEQAIFSWVRRWKRKHHIQGVVVDYLQLLRVGGSSDYERATAASTLAKRLASEVGIAVVVLAQLGRDSEGRKPVLSDLKSSGQIEQDADVVAALWTHGGGRVLSVLKDRDGKIGDIKLCFNGEFARIMEEEKA